MVSVRLLPLMVAGLSLMLAACQADKKEFNTATKIMSESATLRENVINKCTAKWKNYTRDLTEEFVKEIGVPRDKTVETYCERLYKGLASGRITYEDMKKLETGYRTPAFVAVIRGR